MVVKETTYKGTRILYQEEAWQKRVMINTFVEYLLKAGFDEISIPIIQYQEIFKAKVGEENNNLMFKFKDRGHRDLCLAPEYTAIIQKLSQGIFRKGKDVKLFYIQECFRGEKPQAGRYRQFTQLGVEILHPKCDYTEDLLSLAENLLKVIGIGGYNINRDQKRGLDYYKDGKGFEIEYSDLGTQKQIIGGGQYEGGTGFAIGVDRLLEIKLDKCKEHENK